tara:strand:- start:260 stop:1240 length:981 start_codon:yes stop_codon:yes gene_type:complete
MPKNRRELISRHELSKLKNVAPGEYILVLNKRDVHAKGTNNSCVESIKIPIRIHDDSLEILGSLNVLDKLDVLEGTISKYPTSGNDIASKDYVDANAGGSVALNDLTDVTYSSGDLTITGLDKIVADDIVLDSSADITLDASSGNFIAQKGGVEFSVANSAYAGMILGYTYLHPTTTLKSFEIQNAITVEDDDHKITFKTPPSQKVEIEVTSLINCLSTDVKITVGLSSANATDGYSAVAGQFEYDSTGIFFTDDEVDDDVLTFKFVVESANLAAIGSENTFWIGFGTGGSTKTAYLQYGYRSTHGIGNHPFIIKATALPGTIYTG